MTRIHLTARQWAFIHPLLPPPARTGRPRADDRRAIEGIVWGWSSAFVGVRFFEVQIPRVSPREHTPFGEPRARPRVIHLRDLAAVRGHADDPDFLLGNSDQFGGRITNKRFKLLQSDLAGALDGLARATERYASDILRGDLSIPPEVQAYRDEKP
jgi:hypothetical protein